LPSSFLSHIALSFTSLVDYIAESSRVKMNLDIH